MGAAASRDYWGRQQNDMAQGPYGESLGVRPRAPGLDTRYGGVIAAFNLHAAQRQYDLGWQRKLHSRTPHIVPMI
jgi:hypothetical protein